MTVDRSADSIVGERLRRASLCDAVPAPSPSYRVQAWIAFQRALDPLARPRPLRQPRHS